MAFKGQRKGVPSARYAGICDVIETTGWTYDEVMAQPWDLVEELHIRLRKRRVAEAYATRVAKLNGKRAA